MKAINLRKRKEDAVEEEKIKNLNKLKVKEMKAMMMERKLLKNLKVRNKIKIKSI